MTTATRRKPTGGFYWPDWAIVQPMVAQIEWRSNRLSTALEIGI